jgi:hypothetical protein
MADAARRAHPGGRRLPGHVARGPAEDTYGHHHPDYLKGAPAAIGQKGRYVSVVETVVSLTEDQNEKKKPNKIWSEWQDLNLRPLRPERSALPG